MNKIQTRTVSLLLLFPLLSLTGCGLYQYNRLGGEMYAAQNDYIECVKQNPNNFEEKCKALREIYRVKKEKYESHPLHRKADVSVDVREKKE